MANGPVAVPAQDRLAAGKHDEQPDAGAGDSG
jgi:hypothetical protein